MCDQGMCGELIVHGLYRREVYILSSVSKSINGSKNCSSQKKNFMSAAESARYTTINKMPIVLYLINLKN